MKHLLYGIYATLMVLMFSCAGHESHIGSGYGGYGSTSARNGYSSYGSHK
ncbi:hypothetical protein [Burkholderia gladioli]